MLRSFGNPKSRDSVRSTRNSVRMVVAKATALLLLFPLFVQADPPTDEEKRAFQTLFARANAPWTDWAFREGHAAMEWRRNSGLPSHLYVRLSDGSRREFSREQLQTFTRTQRTIDIVQPNPLQLFVESANPFYRQANGEIFRWDSLGLVGLKDPSNIARLLDQSLQLGLTDLRLGLDLGEVDASKPETLDNFVNHVLVPMWERGMFPILTLDWFANTEKMAKADREGKTNRYFSFLNNPKYIEDRVKLADMVSKRVYSEIAKFNQRPNKTRQARIAWNSINELHTRVAFSEHFWEESERSGYNWSHPELQRLHIPAMINVGRAVAGMRYVIESNSKGYPTLHIVNEAMTPDYYPTHDGYFRFATLKLAVGHEVFANQDLQSLMTEPLSTMQARLTALEKAKRAKGEKLNEFEGMLKTFIFGSWNSTPEKKESARRMLITMLQRYQRDLQKLNKDFKITLRDGVIMAGDYYAQSEFIPPKPVPVLALELARHNGKKLKQALDFERDSDLFQRLKETAERAEKKVGAKIWKDYANYSQITSKDLYELLTVEDGVMMDLLIGFRYANWELDKSKPAVVERQKKLGLDKSMKIITEARDEYRADDFLNLLLEKGEAKLRNALGAKDDNDLRRILIEAAQDTSDGGAQVKVSAQDSVRDILNKNSRRVLMRLFGLKNQRMLGFLPPHYPIQIRAGIREGVGKILLSYADAAGILHIAIGESGSPYVPWREDVEKQMAMSASLDAATAGYMFVFHAFGPASHTVGWDPGPMNGTLETHGNINRSGVFEFTQNGSRFDYAPAYWEDQNGRKAPWVITFTEPILKSFAQSRARLAAIVKEAAEVEAIRKAERKTTPRRTGAMNRCEAAFAP